MAINRYHGSAVSWRSRKDLEGNFVGLELETENENGGAATDNAIVNSGVAFKGDPPICETDASLDGYKGVEVICPPVSLSSIHKTGGFVDKILEVLVESGATVDPPRNYGMHMNINIKGWPYHFAVLTTFVLRCLRSVATDLGKRTGEAGSAGNETEYWSPRNKVLVHENTFDVYNNSKYSPAWIRHNNPNVMEVRYPRAILTGEHIRRNVSFVYSIYNFLLTPAGYWAALFALTTNKYDFVETVYLNWLQYSTTYKKLAATVNRPQNFDKTFTLQGVKLYAKKIYESNPNAYEEAKQRCAAIAAANPLPKTE